MDFRTPKCKHNQKGMCIHCLVNRGKKQKKQSNKMQEESIIKQKCKHPSHMKCLKCLPRQQKQSKCKHPDYEQCKHCQNYIMYQTFEQYLQTLQSDCKHKKPCPKCQPPLSRKTYSIDKQCRNHAPYPQAQCDSCMAPTITIKKQRYSHASKVRIQTPSIYKISETNAIGVLIGIQNNGVIQVHDIYFPEDQDFNSKYITPQALGKFNPLFSYFGLKEVGIIYSSPEVTSMALIISSMFQQYFSTVSNGHEISRFITMRLQYGNQEMNFDPHFECFQVSDQFQAFHRHNLIYQKQQNVPYFDLITAKHQQKMSQHPTFLREGVQTDIIKFKEIINWIPTIYQQNSEWVSQYSEESSYPFFSIQNQTIDHANILVKSDFRQPLQKYRNIQFLLHLTKLIGLNSVMIFLNDFFLDNPDLFLIEKLAQCQKIQEAKQKEARNPDIYRSGRSLRSSNNSSMFWDRF